MLSSWLAPLFYAAAALLIAWGLWQGLWMVPKDDYQGGDIMRVMFIHVPAAWLAMASYLGMAVMSFVWFIWRHEVADIAAKAIAPLGATWTALCLATGAIWGKPTWGTWWQWDDARMMSVLFMFFLFLGYMALRAAMDTPEGPKMAAVYLWPLLISSLGHSLLFAALVMTLMRAEIWTRRAAQSRARLMTGD